MVGASQALWAVLCSTSLALRWDTSCSPTRTFPSSSPPQGAWLLASQGPYVGTVMWPQAERSSCLFAEGGKTTWGLLIQPHLGAPGSAASVCPGCPGSDYARLVGVEQPRGCRRPAGQGWVAPAFPRKQRKKDPDFADGRLFGP